MLTVLRLALAVVVSAAAWSVPIDAAIPAGPGDPQAQRGAINGVATSAQGQNLANVTLQLRDLATGQVVGSTTTSATGQFSFVGLNPASYAIEILNVAGEVVATSASVTVATGAVVSGITVTVPTALVGAAAGGAAAGAAAGGAAVATVSTAATVTTAAAAAGVAGAVAAATQPTASPSR